MSKIIKNKVKNADKISVKEFLSWEFNNIKESKNRDVSELINSIKEFGFAVPVFIWSGKDEVYVLDGTGRSLAVKQMMADGYEFESIPVVEILAETKKQAMELVPSIASSFGEVTRDSMITFSKGLDLKFENIKIEGISKLVLEDENFNYHNKNKEVVMGGNGRSSGGGRGNVNEDGFKTCPNCGYELSDDEE